MVCRHATVPKAAPLAMVREAHIDSLIILGLGPRICKCLANILQREITKGA